MAYMNQGQFLRRFKRRKQPDAPAKQHRNNCNPERIDRLFLYDALNQTGAPANPDVFSFALFQTLQKGAWIFFRKVNVF